MRNLAVPTLLALAPSVAGAHNYLEPEPDGTTTIPEIEVSRVVYRLLPPAVLHRYDFSAAVGQPIFVQLLGPHEGVDALYHPSFALVLRGHALDPRTARLEHGRLVEPGPFRELLGAGEADGVVIAAGDGADFELFHEPFTGTDYRMRQTLELLAPVAGSYQIVVFDPAAEQGRYILATGQAERFGAGDVLRFPQVWLEVRRFMGESTAPLWIAVGLLAAAAAGGTVWLVLHLTR